MTGRETDDGYTIRAYEQGDERAFISLYNEVWSAEKTTDWFDWPSTVPTR